MKKQNEQTLKNMCVRFLIQTTYNDMIGKNKRNRHFSYHTKFIVEISLHYTFIQFNATLMLLEKTML